MPILTEVTATAGGDGPRTVKPGDKWHNWRVNDMPGSPWYNLSASDLCECDYSDAYRAGETYRDKREQEADDAATARRFA